ncbi:formin-like protein [Schistocerca gregaria]|uniref:formin-like protein n=1 Tax=Schistocerca gregaria TaxID=7010 RepID=UPI00211E4E64|nr:formin-like protein [Schistocerca gregaria]XP_049850500.1 formin-like protein [Schistocerca gregaria]
MNCMVIMSARSSKNVYHHEHSESLDTLNLKMADNGACNQADRVASKKAESEAEEHLEDSSRVMHNEENFLDTGETFLKSNIQLADHIGYEDETVLNSANSEYQMHKELLKNLARDEASQSTDVNLDGSVNVKEDVESKSILLELDEIDREDFRAAKGKLENSSHSSFDKAKYFFGKSNEVEETVTGSCIYTRGTTGEIRDLSKCVSDEKSQEKIADKAIKDDLNSMAKTKRCSCFIFGNNGQIQANEATEASDNGGAKERQDEKAKNSKLFKLMKKVGLGSSVNQCDSANKIDELTGNYVSNEEAVVKINDQEAGEPIKQDSVNVDRSIEVDEVPRHEVLKAGTTGVIEQLLRRDTIETDGKDNAGEVKAGKGEINEVASNVLIRAADSEVSKIEDLVNQEVPSKIIASDEMVDKLHQHLRGCLARVNEMNKFVENMRRIKLEVKALLSGSEDALLKETYDLKVAVTVLKINLDMLEDKETQLTKGCVGDMSGKIDEYKTVHGEEGMSEEESHDQIFTDMEKTDLVKMLEESKKEVEVLKVENAEIRGIMLHLSNIQGNGNFTSQVDMTDTPMLASMNLQGSCIPPPPPDPSLLLLDMNGRKENGCPSPGSVPLGVKPSVRMKGFHWFKIPLHQINQTVFAMIDPLRVYIDSEALEANFRVRESKILSKVLKKSKELTFVDSKRLLNVGIFLQTLKIPYRRVIRAIRTLESRVLTSELTRRLQDILPTDEEVKNIRNYVSNGGSLESLQIVDQFFYKISRIPQFRARLKVYEYKINYDLRACELEIIISRLEGANEELKKNTPAWVKLLEVVLAIGNFLNYNSPRGGARGFQIECLSQLSSIKSLDNTFTLLDYLVEYLHEMGKYSDALDLPNTSRSILQVSKLDWNAVINDMLYLRKQLSDTNALLMTIERSNVQEDTFFDTIQMALKAIERKLDVLEHQFNQTCNQYREIAREYGVVPQSMLPSEFYKMLNSFLVLFENAIENYKTKLANAQKKESGICFCKGAIRKKIIQKELELIHATGDVSGFSSSIFTN